MRYKDTWQTDGFIANNGWDTKHNQVSIWVCKKTILKKVWFDKDFTSSVDLIVFNSEAILALLNKQPPDDLTYLSRCTPVSVAIHDVSNRNREPVYLVVENPVD